MMLLEAMRTIVQAIAQLVVLGFIGFWLIKRDVVHEAGLKVLSDAVIGFFLPLFMFSQIIARFSFRLYPDWWVFPLLSFLITASGYLLGLLALGIAPSLESHRGEFLGVISFQNSGYLPLPLVAALLPAGAAQEMFIYIFLFLIGFNMTIFSFGFWLLSPPGKRRRFDYQHIFNAPVVATLLALIFVFFKINALFPKTLVTGLETIGRAAIPLSILVVGGNLASITSKAASALRSVSAALMIKLVILPLVFLGFVLIFHFSPLIGLLIVLQAAMPPAALLSVISKSQNSEGPLVNMAIFYGHLFSIVTISLFLTLYGTLAGSFF